MKRTILTLLSLFAVIIQDVTADIIINEVMSNEPGDSVSLEWIEFYNNSDSVKMLTFYSLGINGAIFMFPAHSVGAREYFVVCRRLIDSSTSVGFETAWGNADGIWGNSDNENYWISRISGMSLKNDSGTVTLLYASSVKSVFKWSEKGNDGVSWERFTPTSSAIGQSINLRGGTPGGENSITPAEYDLSLVSAKVKPSSGGFTQLEFTVVNVGLNIVSGADLALYYDYDEDSMVTPEDLIITVDLPYFNLGDTFQIIENLEFDGIYSKLLAKLTDDDRTNNNIKQFIAPGTEFPPIVVNEFLPDPEVSLGTEWIELKNWSDTSINLKGWLVGDSVRLLPIATRELILEANEYLILCEDSAAFKSFYSGVNDSDIIEIKNWTNLNNDGDIVRLRDLFGFTADSFEYDIVFGDNYTWGRGEELGRENSWGRSKEPGGAPMALNDVYYLAVSDNIKVSVEPNPFSPSKDGQTKIAFTAPSGNNLRIKIFDIDGQMVKSLIDNIQPVDGAIEWDGRDDDNRILPPGIYILYVEISGKADYKQTIVVAP